MTAERHRNRPQDVTLLGVLKNQGGGHGKIRKISGKESAIAKPAVNRERAFYRKIQCTAMQSIVPGYFGSFTSGGDSWIMLRDLTAGMSSPCIADVKLGSRMYELNAPADKKARQISRAMKTTAKTHCVRCIDICIREAGNVVRRWGKNEGANMSGGELKETIRLFIPGKRRAEFAKLISGVRDTLELALEKMPGMRLYSASLLIVYDGDCETKPMTIKIIDFAHAYTDIVAEGGDISDESYDDNAIEGLDNMLSFTQDEQEIKW